VSSITQSFNNPVFLNDEIEQLKVILKRGGLARAGVGESYSLHGAEEAALNALRQMMPLGALADASDIFVSIVGHEKVKEAEIEKTLELISHRINPDADLLCGRFTQTDLKNSTTVNLLVTGVSFPYTWGGYRKLPIELHEIEPESGEEERLGIRLDLHQLEQLSTQPNL
jgi:cell division protein FtsZ